MTMIPVIATEPVQHEVKAHPIIFSGPMVRRIIAGQKSQTRRLITPQPFVVWSYSVHAGLHWQPEGECSRNTPCRYGRVGDLFWVREAYCPRYAAPCIEMPNGHAYRADWTGECADVVLEPRWTSPIYMPHSHSRLTLELTDVRVERLQDISDEDIHAEGADTLTLDELIQLGASRRTILAKMVQVLPHHIPGWWTWEKATHMWPRSFTFQERWRVAWDSINGNRVGARWADNPWVWVLRFRRIDGVTP